MCSTPSSGTTTEVDPAAQVTSGLLLGATAPTILERVFDSLAPSFGLDVYVHYVRRGVDDHLTLVAAGGIDRPRAAGIATLPLGEAVCGRVAQRGTTHVASDVLGSSDPAYALLRDLGVQAYVCHPLLRRSQVVGTLSFGSRQRRSFDPHEVATMRTVADALALGVALAMAERSLDGFSGDRAWLRAHDGPVAAAWAGAMLPLPQAPQHGARPD